MCIDGLARLTEAVAKPGMVFQSTDETNLGPRLQGAAQPNPSSFPIIYKSYYRNILTALNFFPASLSVNQKGGLGAAVEPTVCNQKVLGSSPSLCTFVWVRLEA